MAEAVASCGEGAGAVTIGSRTKGSSSAPNAEANARQNTRLAKGPAPFLSLVLDRVPLHITAIRHSSSPRRDLLLRPDLYVCGRPSNAPPCETVKDDDTTRS